MVAWLKLLTLSASGGGQAHAVRRAADGWLRDRSSPPPTPSRHHFMSGGADVMDAHMRALSGCGGRIASAARPCVQTTTPSCESRDAWHWAGRQSPLELCLPRPRRRHPARPARLMRGETYIARVGCRRLPRRLRSRSRPDMQAGTLAVADLRRRVACWIVQVQLVSATLTYSAFVQDGG